MCVCVVAAFVHSEPNSARHFSYCSSCAALTELEILESASWKSSLVSGRSISSAVSVRISSVLRPLVRRRIGIKLASRHTLVMSAPL